MSKAPNLTTLDKLFKRANLSQRKVCQALNITDVRLTQIKRNNFNGLNIKYLYLLSSMLNLRPFELLYLLHYDILDVPCVPIVDEEKLNSILENL